MIWTAPPDFFSLFGRGARGSRCTRASFLCPGSVTFRKQRRARTSWPRWPTVTSGNRQLQAMSKGSSQRPNLRRSSTRHRRLEQVTIENVPRRGHSRRCGTTTLLSLRLEDGQKIARMVRRDSRSAREHLRACVFDSVAALAPLCEAEFRSSATDGDGATGEAEGRHGRTQRDRLQTVPGQLPLRFVIYACSWR